jgi:acyl-CoA synthetase (AMP-forming)/AMP-acid ligase II
LPKEEPVRHLDLVAGSLARTPGKAAVVAGDRVLTFAEVDARIDRLGAALQEHGVRPGDRVALLAANELEYLEVQGACLRYGFALVPLNVRLAVPELDFILRDCAPALLVAGRGREEVVAALASDARPDRVLGLGDPTGLPSYDEALASAPAPLDPPLDPALIATILYTSGTTGRPKGAMIDRAGFSARVLINSVELRVRAHDVHLAVLPMFHIAAFLTYAHVANGATLVMLEEFSPEAALAEIERAGVTTTCLVPTIIAMLTNHPDRPGRDLSRLRLVIYGGSSIDPEPLRAAIAAFGCEFHQQYGMTESGGQTILRPEDHDPADVPRLRSAGTEAVGVQVRIVDDEDRPLPPGEPGEIVCRAASLMVGYWNRPDATEEALRGGWFHTGDIGLRDERGYLHVTDRRNDMIVSGGENVYPREVETVLVDHPGIAEVAVVGVPDALWGHVVTAVLVGTEAPDDEALVEWARARLASYKVPRRWVRVDDLPRNVTGKVLKHELRARLAQAPRNSG